MANIDVKDSSNDSANESKDNNFDVKTNNTEAMADNTTISEDATAESAAPAAAESAEPVADTATAPEASTEAADAPQEDSKVAETSPLAAEAAPKADKPHRNANLVHLLAEGILVVLVVALALWGWSEASDRNNLQKQLDQANANPQSLVEKQSQALITRVGKLMTLPTGETPTVANVSDAAAAKKQSAFFNNAANGDKVLMYVKAGEAILYRPSTNKIILVAPLTFNNTQAQAAAPATGGAASTAKPATSR